MMNKGTILSRSIWVFHFGSGTCNNCDIEILDALTPRYDVERFGVKLIGSIRHADCLLVTGSINRKGRDKLKHFYEIAPKPLAVVAFGACGCTKGIFKDSYNSYGPVQDLIPVDLFIPGCPPRPEAIIEGIVKAVKVLRS